MTILAGFFGFVVLVLYQTIAKKAGLPLLSNGLNHILDKAIVFWQWLGEVASKWLNIYDWLNNLWHYVDLVWNFLKDYIWQFMLDAWQFILDHVWGNLKPFLESVGEIMSPVWKLVFSPVYFFVGFAKTHYLFFSYLGGGVVLLLLAYFTRGYWLKLNINSKSIVIGVVVVSVGVLAAYPTILPQLFPRSAGALEEFSRNPDDRSVQVAHRTYTVRQLKDMDMATIKQIFIYTGMSRSGCGNSKSKHIERLLEYEYVSGED